MKEFLDRLYEIPNFTLYLVVAIAVLLFIFFLILILGKKDQKNEETKRLELLTHNENNNVNVPNNENKGAEKTEILLAPHPNINNESNNNEVPTLTKMPTEQIPKLDLVKEIDENPVISLEELDNTKPKEEPLKVDIENELNNIGKPVFEQTLDIPIVGDTKTNMEVVPEIKKDEIEIPVKEEIIIPVVDLPKEEIVSIKEEPIKIEEIPEIKIPEFNYEELTSSLKDEYKDKKEEKKFEPSKVFSSVYVNDKPKEEVKQEVKEDDFMEFELPKLKSEVKNPEIKEENQNNSFSFNMLSGESYNLKK